MDARNTQYYAPICGPSSDRTMNALDDKMVDVGIGSSSASSKPDMMKLKNAIHRSLQKGGFGAQFVLKEEKASSAQCWLRFAHVCHTDGTPVKEFDSGYVACTKCHVVYTYEMRHGTSSLNGHRCRLVAANAGAMRLFATTVQPTTSQKRQVARAAMMMCCEDLRPFSIVEDAGFRCYSQVLLDIGISVGRGMKVDDLIPSRFTVKHQVIGNAESLHDVVKAKFKEHFAEKMHAGFTVDLWTDSIKRTSFMSITSHYIDNAFKQHVRTLQVPPLHDESHIAVRVLKAFKECIQEFGCDENERCVVCSDSGLNMCGGEGIQTNLKWLSCSDHKIATVLTTVLNKTTTTTNGIKSAPFYKFEDAGPEVFELIDNCKELVRHVKQSNLQRALKNTLKQENATRWNSLLRMLKSVSRSYEEVSNLLLNKGGTRAVLIA
ncbi:hypothetical protein CBR_g30459 [Chara braunii]|uniref:Hermes trasposase DNA-binding domain-containing protein n=1 Tax=Chara braunii TaxID=69332 RepID=A0A388LD20_CHABU|nr:hypothetical protein CBR_g30459 [Chara braunii]|eukprot:GBG80092.1 hypothetical protein CBR_g30459 [Chara braunii]